MTTILDWSKSLVYEMHQTHVLIQKRLAERLAKSKRITFSQFLVLMALSCCKGASQRDVATYLFLTEATVSRHIQVLMKEGLLTKIINPKSKRESILTLTTKGKTEIERSQKIIDEEIVSIMSPIKERDRTCLLKTFKQLTHTLHAP